jgi:hypothetical protein
MGAIPGSHKANFPLLAADRPGPITSLREIPPYGKAVPARAGSAIVFTEVRQFKPPRASERRGCLTAHPRPRR